MAMRMMYGFLTQRNVEKRWVSGRSYEEALKRAHTRFPKIPPADMVLHQDEDVLDTWFSAGIWPFSIMGWPKQTQDFKTFFPNSLLETGWDILFFWVARMVMMSLKLTGQVPFKEVFCHAMVRDAHGRKMSKSLGNVIDPLDVISGISLADLQARLDSGNLDPKEVAKAKQGQASDFPNGIPECGADALRFTLLAYTSFGRDLNLDILRVDGYRKFCNKLWNATRFANMKLENFKPRESIALTGRESLAGRWILHKLNKAIKETNQNFAIMNFMAATTAMHQFWLYELCDIYLEVCKPVFDGSNESEKQAAQDVLYICLDQGLKLLHPIMPFVTEELYQRLPRRPFDSIPSIMISAFPQEVEAWHSEKYEADFEYVNSVVKACRSLLSDYGVKQKAKGNVSSHSVYIITDNARYKQVLSEQALVCKALVRGCEILEIVSSAPEGCALSTAVPETKVCLMVKGTVDLSGEIEKMTAKLSKVVVAHDTLHAKMQVPGYKQVREEVVLNDKEKLAGFKAEQQALQAAIEQFKLL